MVPTNSDNVSNTGHTCYTGNTGPYWYSVDGEPFEAIPLNVTLLRNRLSVFSPVDNHL